MADSFGDISDNNYITKKQILTNIPQTEIMERYLKVPIQFNHKFCSPLREDNHPTCTFSWFNNKLYFRDWAEPYPKDCFDVVQEKYLTTFRNALNIIAADFGLIDNLQNIDRRKAIDNANKAIKTRTSSTTEIKVNVSTYCKEDKYYLESYRLKENICRYFNIYSINYAWLNGKLIYTRKGGDPCLGYYFGKDKESNQKWKLYFYKRKKDYRFICNTNRISGWLQIPKKGKVLLWTKSHKDVACLSRFQIPALAMQAETQMPNDHIIEEMKKRFTKHYSLYDFDLTGVKTANKLRKRFNITPLFFTNGRFNTKDYGSKDFSDFLKDNPLSITKQLIKTAKKKLNV